MRKIAYLLSLLMIFMIPWERIVFLPGLGTMSRLMGFLVLGIWLLSVITTGKIRKITPFHGLIFVFFLWNAISLLWSYDIDQTLNRSFAYIRMAGLVLVIWNLYDSPAAVRAGLQVFVLGSFIPVMNLINNYIVGNRAGFVRYAISGNNFNTSGIVIAFVIPIAFYLAATANSNTKDQILRYINYAYIPAALFAIGLTATRFALIMAVPAFIFGLWTFTNLKPLTRVVVLILMLIALILLPSVIPDTATDRLATIGQEVDSGDLNGRTVLWMDAINLWNDHPILGIGSAAFNKAVAPIYGRPRAAHNSFIAVLTETGIIGIVLLGSILVVAIIHAFRFPKIEAWFWITMLVVWALGNLALTWTHTKSTWILFGILIAFAYLPIYQNSSESSMVSENSIQVPNI